MKQKFLACFLALCLTLSLLPGTARAAVVASGTCGAEGDGSNVTWTLDDTGLLTISGTGAMENYGSLDQGSIPAPWYDAFNQYNVSIESVEIQAGVTSIGSCAFLYCVMTSITIPDSVTSIGGHAFYRCTDLTSITIPDSVTSIEDSAFEYCYNLTSITIPDGVTSIGSSAFSYCDSLTSVTIQNGVKSIGNYAFYYCTGLTSITIPDSVTSISGSAFSGSNVETVYYSGNPTQWLSLTEFVGEFNSVYYTPTITSSSTVDDTGATIVISSDIAFKEDISEADLTVADTAGLTLESVSLDTAARSGDNKTLTVRFSGQSQQGGNLSVTLKSSAFSVLVGAEDGTNSYSIPTVKVPASAPEEEAPGESEPDTPVDPDDSGSDSDTPDVPGESEPDPEPVPDEPVEDVPPVVPSFPTQAPSNSSSNSKDEPEDVQDPAAPVVVAVDDTVQTQEQASLPISGTGESEMQYIVKDTEHADWIDRVDLPQYATDLYHVLTIGGDHDDLYDILISDEYQTLPAPGASGGTGTGANAAAEVESVLTLVADLNDAYSSGSGAFQEESFTGSFDVIDASSGDKAIDYGSLKEGDVVRTPSYNAIFVTSLRKDGNSNYEAELKEATTYASTAFQAFDRDCPEVFWLSGKMKLRMVTATIRSGSETYKQTYIFFTLVDADGFTVRDSAYPNQAAVEAGIARREAAVNTILASVTGDTVYEQVTQLNRWLTEHNHYNTSADLLNLPNAPHECLSALEGNVGTSGPVCDGYSRAFKVLCDRLGISCVLVDGYAVVQAGSPGEFHMWNSVQMSDGKWYGVDVTWNDPIVSGVTDAKSGREREDFLLVGAETEVLGLKFSVSHPPRNQAADSGVCFTNGPTLSVAAYQPLAAASVLPFKDVSAASWYYASVQYVFEQGLMVGTGTDTFSPGQTLTRAMAWTFLSRLAGEEAAGGTPWYSGAQSWASREGVSDGSDPDGAVTRQQLVTMLWRYAGSPASSGSLDSFTDSNAVSSYAADALRWAVESGIISGMNDGTIQPDGTADRAQVAAILERFCQR